LFDNAILHHGLVHYLYSASTRPGDSPFYTRG